MLVSDKTSPKDPIVDWTAALLRAGGDIDFLRELVPIFIEQEVELVEVLRSGIATHNNDVVSQAAHTLKGAIINFTQGAAYERTCTVEKLGPAGEWDQAEQEFDALQSELQLLNAALSDFRSEHVTLA